MKNSIYYFKEKEIIIKEKEDNKKFFKKLCSFFNILCNHKNEINNIYYIDKEGNGNDLIGLQIKNTINCLNIKTFLKLIDESARYVENLKDKEKVKILNTILSDFRINYITEKDFVLLKEENNDNKKYAFLKHIILHPEKFISNKDINLNKVKSFLNELKRRNEIQLSSEIFVFLKDNKLQIRKKDETVRVGNDFLISTINGKQFE